MFCADKMSTVFVQRSSNLIRVAHVRFSSGALPAIQTKKVDSNIELRMIETDGRVTHTRPMVLLFSWLLAKKRHLSKYGNLYLSEGVDVLNIKVEPTQVLMPKKAQLVAERLLTTLQKDVTKDKPLLVHGFSVGGYMYGEMLKKLHENQEKYADIRQRMIGQVFDSPVDFEGVPRGFANVLSTNPVVKATIKGTLDMYLSLFRNSVTRHYIEASHAFHNNDMHLPSLFLYSRADPIGVAEIIEEVIEKWKNAKIPVQSKCWENSPHVSHFHRHPDEYVDALLSFLESVKIRKPEAQDSEEAVVQKASVVERQP